MSMNYTKKYLKIYFFQGLSTLLGFVSLFIVLPYITSNQVIYGVYSICLSLTIYFSYADLGFGTAGQKFAVESYISGDKDEEIQIVGFTTFVFLAFMGVVSLIVLLLSINPVCLVKDIDTGNIIIAKKLLVLLALSSPVMAFDRALNIIYSIRLEDYKFQRIHILCNVIKICSAFYFFTNGRYLIVEYYAFLNFINLCGVLYSLIYVSKHYQYKLSSYLKNIRFNKIVFSKVSGLAVAGLVTMIAWVLYYELDQVAIGSMFGARSVAIYAVAFSLLSYSRTFLGIIFSPLTARFNYFIGQGNIQGLHEHVISVCSFFFPIVVFPLLSLSFFSKQFILAWVGQQYVESIIHTRLLVLCNILAFLSYPISTYITSLKKNKELIKGALLIVVVFWAGMIILRSHIGILSFSGMKLVAFMLSAIYYVYVLCRIQDIKISHFIKGILKSNIVPFIFGILIMSITSHLFVIEERSAVKLFVVMAVMGITATVPIVLSAVTNPIIKNKLKEFIHYV